jgi:hypothetical protein
MALTRPEGLGCRTRRAAAQRRTGAGRLFCLAMQRRPAPAENSRVASVARTRGASAPTLWPDQAIDQAARLLKRDSGGCWLRSATSTAVDGCGHPQDPDPLGIRYRPPRLFCRAKGAAGSEVLGTAGRCELPASLLEERARHSINLPDLDARVAALIRSGVCRRWFVWSLVTRLIAGPNVPLRYSRGALLVQLWQRCRDGPIETSFPRRPRTESTTLDPTPRAAPTSVGGGLLPRREA